MNRKGGYFADLKVVSTIFAWCLPVVEVEKHGLTTLLQMDHWMGAKPGLMAIQKQQHLNQSVLTTKKYKKIDNVGRTNIVPKLSFWIFKVII